MQKNDSTHTFNVAVMALCSGSSCFDLKSFCPLFPPLFSSPLPCPLMFHGSNRPSRWMKAQWRKWSWPLRKGHTKTRNWGSSFLTILRSKHAFPLLFFTSKLLFKCSFFGKLLTLFPNQVHGVGAGSQRHHPGNARDRHHAGSLPPAGGAQCRPLPVGPSKPWKHRYPSHGFWPANWFIWGLELYIKHNASAILDLLALIRKTLENLL